MLVRLKQLIPLTYLGFEQIKKTRLVVLDHSKRELNALQFNYVNKDMHIQRVRTCVKEYFLEVIVLWLNASQKNASWCLGEHI